MAPILYVNDLDLGELGCKIEAIEGWADPLTLRLQGQAVAQRVGQLPLTVYGGAVEPRDIVVRGTITGATEADLVTARAELKDQCGRGLVELRVKDAPELMALAYLTRGIFAGVSPQFLAPWWTRVALTFTCLDPLFYTKSPTVIGMPVTGVDYPCPLGTAPSLPLIRIFAATNPLLSYNASTGAVRQTMGFTVTLGANDYIEIDCDAKTITKSVAGVISDGISTLVSGDFPVLDPQDADYAGAVWPTMSVLTSGTGELVYRRAWA